MKRDAYVTKPVPCEKCGSLRAEVERLKVDATRAVAEADAERDAALRELRALKDLARAWATTFSDDCEDHVDHRAEARLLAAVRELP